MQYAYARILRETMYQAYVTDVLKAIATNTAYRGGGEMLTARFFDCIHPPKLQDQRTGDEIAADVIKRAGLEVIPDGSI